MHFCPAILYHTKNISTISVEYCTIKPIRAANPNISWIITPDNTCESTYDAEESSFIKDNALYMP